MDQAPKLKKNFICIADRHSPELAAMVSTYLAEDGYFLPFFEIQGVTAPYSKPIADPPDEDTFSQRRAESVCHSILNAIVRLGGCEHVVLVGLSADQKSYLQLPDEIAVISIDSEEDVVQLSAFHPSPKPYLNCLPEDYLQGQFEAVRMGHWLKFDRQASLIADAMHGSDNCVVVENDGSSMAVMAVNYALSVGADLVIVSPLAEDGDKDVLYCLADWQQNGDVGARDQLLDAINTRIGPYDFSSFRYVIFFTAGVPYSLVLGSTTCCTYVHMHAQPDHFTFNGILYAAQPGTGAGLVFSPLELTEPLLDGAQEEVNVVSSALAGMHYHAVQMVSASATVYNFSRYVQHYPFDLLHICSHGGEIPGNRVQTEFVAKDGKAHTVVFDHVLSFAATPYRRNAEPLIEVHHMAFPRAYNGFTVGSKELGAQQYSPSFYVECQNVVVQRTKRIDTLLGHVEQVTDSRSIMCADHPFHAMINYLAGDMRPIVFNNTCWSWGPVAMSFLVTGARGYIGTLWPIGDDAAVDSARAFYHNVETMPVAEAIWHAARQYQPAEDANIYVYYGFPFTRLHPGTTTRRSRLLVRWQLLRRREALRRKRQAATAQQLQEHLDYVIAWHDEVIAMMATQ